MGNSLGKEQREITTKEKKGRSKRRSSPSSENNGKRISSENQEFKEKKRINGGSPGEERGKFLEEKI